MSNRIAENRQNGAEAQDHPLKSKFSLAIGGGIPLYNLRLVRLLAYLSSPHVNEVIPLLVRALWEVLSQFCSVKYHRIGGNL